MNYSRANVSSGLRKKLQPASFANAETLVPQHGNPATFLTVKVAWSGKEELADICGYLIMHTEV